MSLIKDKGSFQRLLEQLAQGQKLYAPLMVRRVGDSELPLYDITADNTSAGDDDNWASSLGKEALGSDYRLIWKNDFHGGLDRICAVGRSRDNDLQVKDDSVSSHHARICLNNTRNGYVIEDLNSKNKTLLNGEEIVPNVKIPLWSGVCIALGQAVFMFFEPRELVDLSEMMESTF